MIQDIQTPDNWRDLEATDWALRFPRHDQEDRAAIRQSILRIGFDADTPIILYRGKILDGVGRHTICKEENVEPRFAEWAPSLEGDDPWLFALRLNHARRQLTKSQKIAFAVEGYRLRELRQQGLAAMAKGGMRGGKIGGRGNKKGVDPGSTPFSETQRALKSRDILAEELGVSGKHVQYAIKLAKEAPETLERVQTGEIGSAKKAYETLFPPKPRATKSRPSETAKTNEPCKDSAPEEEPTHFFDGQPYACQTECYSNVALRGQRKQPPTVILGNDITIAAERLSRYYDANQTEALIVSCSRFWLPYLTRRVIDSLLRERCKDHEEATATS